MVIMKLHEVVFPLLSHLTAQRTASLSPTIHELSQGQPSVVLSAPQLTQLRSGCWKQGQLRRCPADDDDDGSGLLPSGNLT